MFGIRYSSGMLSHHYTPLCMLWLMLFALAVDRASCGSWVSTNPGGGGALNSPVIFPLSGSGAPNVYVVGSDLGGLYISFNQGKNYRAVGATSGLLATHVSCMAAFQLKSGPWRLLVGTDKGIFVGTFRTNVAAVPTFSQIRWTRGGYIAAFGIAANRPGNNPLYPAQVVYATMYAGYPWDGGNTPIILRSDDSGQSFNSVAHNLPSYLQLRIVGMRCHPTDPKGVWAISGKGRFASSVAQAYFSKDSGATWTRMDPYQGRVVDVAYTLNPNNLNEILLTTEGQSDENPSSPPPAAIYYNAQTGYGQWTSLSTNVGDGVSGYILADATNSNHIRTVDFRFNSISQTFLRESFDGGRTWTSSLNVIRGGWIQDGQTWGFWTSFQGALQTIGYRPDAPNYIVWVDAQDVKQSSDGGKTWYEGFTNKVGSNSFRSRGLDNVVPLVVEPSLTNSQVVYAGYADLGLWKSSDGGYSWQPLNLYVKQWNYGYGGLGGNTLTVVNDPVRSNVVWAQITGNLNDPHHLVKSWDGGITWYPSMAGLPSNGAIIESLRIGLNSASNWRTLFVVAGGNIYRSLDDGATWTQVLECGKCVGVRSTSSGVFAFGPNGVWRSTSGRGAAGTFSRLPLPSSMTAGWTSNLHWLIDHWTYSGPVDLTWRGTSEVWLAVVRGGGLYYSSNYGNTWKLVYSSWFVRAVSVDPGSNQVLLGVSSGLYAGGYNSTSKGLLIHNTGTTTTGWQALNAGLVYPFATFITTTSSGQRWLISPGQGVMKWT